MIKLKKILEDKIIICNNCNHSWKLSNGGKDIYKCHKCGNIVKQISKYKIYCDLDSVLTDFTKAFQEISGIYNLMPHEFEKKYGENKFYDLINKKGLKFWTEMPWTKDGKELWNYLINSGYEITVLSAPLRKYTKNSIQGKKIWCEKNLGPEINAIVIENKYEYASENNILIDDLEKNIVPWREKNGIGILHKNTKDTIKELKRLGI